MNHIFHFIANDTSESRDDFTKKNSHIGSQLALERFPFKFVMRGQFIIIIIVITVQ